MFISNERKFDNLLGRYYDWVKSKNFVVKDGTMYISILDTDHFIERDELLE